MANSCDAAARRERDQRETGGCPGKPGNLEPPAFILRAIAAATYPESVVSHAAGSGYRLFVPP